MGPVIGISGNSKLFLHLVVLTPIQGLRIMVVCSVFSLHPVGRHCERDSSVLFGSLIGSASSSDS